MGSISHLRLRQFRNYTELDTDFAPGLNLIVGSNGQGKSNILEAVCYLGLLRSFRTHRITALRQWHTDSFSLHGDFAPQGDELGFSLSVSYGDRRALRVNGNPVQKASEFINRFLCVVFVPEDLQLVKGPASGRRRFMDIVMSQRDGSYLMHLQRYHDALRGRNVLLREPERYPETAISAYNRILARHGSHIMAERQRFAGAFDAYLRKASEELFPEVGEAFSARHSCGVPAAALPADRGADEEAALQQALLELLERTAEQDRREGCTRYGPHRADLMLLLDGRPLAFYGSEGEIRLGSLAMRLASVRLLEETPDARERGVTLLVDDVLGELDPKRRQKFAEAVCAGNQVLLTTTEILPGMTERAERILQVKEGAVKSR